MSNLRHIYRNLKLKHIPSKRYNRKYDPKYLDELASKGCSVKLGFGDFDGDYDLDGTYPKQRAAVAEKPGIYMNRPLRGPHSMSAVSVPPVEGPLVLESEISEPFLGPVQLSSVTEIPVQGPTILTTQTVKPVEGPQILTSTTVAPAEAPLSLNSTVVAPAAGPTSANSTVVIPAEGPALIDSTVVAPAAGPTLTNGEVVYIPTVGPTSVDSAIVAPAAGPASVNSTVTAPTSSPLSLASTIVAPANGPINIGSTISVPSSGPSNFTSTTVVPVNGPTNTGSTVTVASSGPLNLTSTTVVPANGPTFELGQGAVIDNQLPNETITGTGSSTPDGTSLTIDIPFDSFADSYEVVYSTNQNDPNLVNNTSNKTTVTATGSGGSLTITSTPDTVYYFKVRAVNELTDSSFGWPATPQNYRTNVMNSIYFSRGGYMTRNGSNTPVSSVNPGSTIFDFEFFDLDAPLTAHFNETHISTSDWYTLAEFGGVIGNLQVRRQDNTNTGESWYQVTLSNMTTSSTFGIHTIEPFEKYRLLLGKDTSAATGKVKIYLTHIGGTEIFKENSIASGGWNLPYAIGDSRPALSFRFDRLAVFGDDIATSSNKNWGEVTQQTSSTPTFYFYGPSKYATSGSRDGLTPSGIVQSGNRTILLDQFDKDSPPDFNESGKMNNETQNARYFKDARPYDPLSQKTYSWTRTTNSTVLTDEYRCLAWDFSTQTGRFLKVEGDLLYVSLRIITNSVTNWETHVVPLDHLDTTSRNRAVSLAASAGTYIVDTQNTGFGRLGSTGTPSGQTSGSIEYDDYYYNVHPARHEDTKDWSLSSGVIDVDVDIPYSSLPNIQITEIPNPPSAGPTGLSSVDNLDPNANFVYINVSTNFGHTEAMPILFNAEDLSATGFAETGERNKSVSEFAYSKNNIVQFRAPYYANAVDHFNSAETTSTPRYYYFWVLKEFEHVEQHFSSSTTHKVTFNNVTFSSTTGVTIPLANQPGVSEGNVSAGEIEYSTKTWPIYSASVPAYEYTIIKIPLITSSFTLGAGGGFFNEPNFTKGSEWNLAINYTYTAT